MSLLSILAVLVLFGVLLWAVSALPWIDQGIKKIIYVIMVVVIVVWIMQTFGVLPNLGAVRIK